MCIVVAVAMQLSVDAQAYGTECYNDCFNHCNSTKGPGQTQFCESTCDNLCY